MKKLIAKLFGKSAPTIPVVRMSGVIGEGSRFRPGLNLASVSETLERAFALKKAPAVAIVINSPGGSPVQSHLIFKRIRQLADEKKKKVLVFVEDVAASGGYMIAVAGDEIIGDESSIVGSIGVVAAGFGFDKAIERIGVERRVYTAGTKKAVLDPFQPENEEDVAFLKSLQKDIHAHFISMVKSRRTAKLEDDVELFSGRFWVGETAKAKGLIDEISDIRSFIKQRYGEKAEIKLIEQPKGLLRKAPMGININMPELNGADLLSAMEERATWSRFGL